MTDESSFAKATDDERAREERAFEKWLKLPQFPEKGYPLKCLVREAWLACAERKNRQMQVMKKALELIIAYESINCAEYIAAKDALDEVNVLRQSSSSDKSSEDKTDVKER